jgi:hypothetical protein
LAKILSTRLGVVMDSIISKNQLTFIEGQFLVDGVVVVVNEVIDLAN